MSDAVSDPVYASLDVQGIYLHDPDDPEGTIKNFVYGKAKRSTSLDLASTQLVFAGRRYPVVEFSDNQRDSYNVGVDIPNDELYFLALRDMRSFAESRQALVFRDGRGRAAHGVLSNYREDDQDWGVQIGFQIDRVDYADLELVVL